MSSGLLTDLYELTMAQSLIEQNKTGQAVFSVTVRSLPPERNYLLSCGLESLINKVLAFTFSADDIAYLRGLQRFSESFLTWLAGYRFCGDIIAIPEGRILFEHEPLVRIQGSLPDVQILETIVLNLIHHQTIIASKTARMTAVAGNHPLIDFGLRRAHGLDGGVLASRAAYIGGCIATSNLEAGRRFGIPVSGTMAHSYILVYKDEEEAFRSYIRTYPDEPVLLIDTYNTLSGAETAARLAEEGLPVSGVRIDSGDITQVIPAVRKILDSHGLHQIRIIVSGGVDEHDLDRWVKAGVPIDAYGVGTKMLTSADIPYLDITYKLVEYENIPCCKTSTGKVSVPGRRNIYRHYTDGMMDHDVVVMADKENDGESLSEIVVKDGRKIRSDPSLTEIRDRFRHDYALLPDQYKGLETGRYPVQVR